MEPHKVQFTFNERALNDLDALQEDIDSPSRAETVRYALRFLQWAVNELREGNKICVESKESIREVMFPFIPKPRESDEKIKR